MTTPEKIEKALKTIGWSVDKDPQNRFIRNHKGKRTNLFLRSDALQLEFDNGMWGEGGSGCLFFGYSEIDIKDEKDGCICLMVNPHTFIQFYNHDSTKG